MLLAFLRSGKTGGSCHVMSSVQQHKHVTECMTGSAEIAHQSEPSNCERAADCGLHLYYMPREFSNTMSVVVYSPFCADPVDSCDVIHSVSTRLQTQHPDALLYLGTSTLQLF